MSTPRSMSRAEAIRLVQRLMNADYADEAETDDIIAGLVRGLGCPHISDFVFCDNDPQLTAEKVVDRAVSYGPFVLCLGHSMARGKSFSTSSSPRTARVRTALSAGPPPCLR
ncbi:hypothetical protein [Streptomyces levis]|uniref:hypothetical protein n=1 Tax=Streptomyces levis TaxID=285566 RepID=UPI003C79A70B